MTTWSEEKLKLADPIFETTWDYFDLLSMRVGNVSLKLIAKFKGGDIPSELCIRDCASVSLQKLRFCNTIIFIAELFFSCFFSWWCYFINVLYLTRWILRWNIIVEDYWIIKCKISLTKILKRYSKFFFLYKLLFGKINVNFTQIYPKIWYYSTIIRAFTQRNT